MLGFSVFDNDQTLGEEYKLVLVEVFGQNRFWTTITSGGVKQNVENALRGGQIGFSYVRDISSSPRFNPTYFTFLIVVNALSQHDDETIRRLINSALNPVLGDLRVSVNTPRAVEAAREGVDGFLPDLLGKNSSLYIMGGVLVLGLFLMRR